MWFSDFRVMETLLDQLTDSLQKPFNHIRPINVWKSAKAISDIFISCETERVL